jgi:hypothetical protein
MHADTAFDGEFAHDVVGVDQGPCDRRVIRAPRPSKQGGPRGASMRTFGQAGRCFFPELTPTGFRRMRELACRTNYLSVSVNGRETITW